MLAIEHPQSGDSDTTEGPGLVAKSLTYCTIRKMARKPPHEALALALGMRLPTRQPVRAQPATRWGKLSFDQLKQALREGEERINSISAVESGAPFVDPAFSNLATPEREGFEFVRAQLHEALAEIRTELRRRH